MRNVVSFLNRQNVAASIYHSAIFSTALHGGSVLGTLSRSYPLMRGQTSIEVRRWKGIDWFLSDVNRHFFSTGFTSIHGERPSAEYAKLRKESLESEFGQILGTFNSPKVSVYIRFGPFLALYRAATILFQVVKLTIWQFFLQDTHARAVKFQETLIRLGPFYIKFGQALSTRPDILPNAYCQELAKLQDKIPPFPTHVAFKSIESQLGAPISQIFADISPEPIAAASLGQVYKAHLRTGELVAVKVQRPGMPLSLTLDALLFHMIGGQLKRFAKARKDLLMAVNEMVRHMFDEIDYVLEAQNAERFASLYACYPKISQRSHTGKPVEDGSSNKNISGIKVPKIYWKFTRKAVLTMEWIDGIKLTDADRMEKANLNRKQLVDQGLYCSLRQLLEEGFFHADPHPGNLVATREGSLAYFDFGMMGDIPRHYRVGLIQMLVHFVNRDSFGLANDFLSLGFIPEGADLQSVADALRASFDDGTRQSQDFQGIMNQLFDVMYEFNFNLPPDYSLVIRALGSLEGTAMILDPDFKVVESAYPFVIGQLLADPNPDMRKILRELLIHNNGSIRWNRFERLVMAISEQASTSEDTNQNSSNENTAAARSWKSFNMRSVVAATEDLFLFILSEKGLQVRIFLVQDIIKAADAFLKEEALPCIFEKQEDKESSEFTEGQSVIMRLLNGFRSLRKAVASAPEVWIPLLMRMALKPEAHRFSLDVITALSRYWQNKIPETIWLCLSRLLHKLDARHNSQDS